MKAFRLIAVSILLIFGLSAHALASVVDFEAFPDSFPLTNEIAGFSFSGGTTISAGVSLNELDYPPHSGVNVLAAYSGILTVVADNPFDQFSAYVTFDELLTVSGYDIANNLLFAIDSLVPSNLGLSSLIGHSKSGISSLVFSTSGGSPFILDDLLVASAQSVPEPGTLALVALGCLAASLARWRRNG